MQAFLILSRNDFRMVFRDPLLRGLLLLPFITLLLVFFLLPYIVERFPAIAPYQSVILMWAGVQGGVLFGFLNGFLFIEEKDEQVFSVLQILPLSGRRLLAIRLLAGIGVATLINFILFYGTSIVEIGFLRSVLLALLYAMIAPFLALLVAVFAKNKVEGFAQFKIYNLLVTLPAIIYFLPYKLLHGFAILPSYWCFRAVETVSTSAFWGYFAGGCVVFGIVLSLLVRRFERSVYGV